MTTTSDSNEHHHSGNCAEARPWQFSAKLECNAKGFIQPSIHVYSDKCDCEQLAVILLERTVKELKRSGFKVATDIDKNGKEVYTKVDG